MDDQPASTIAAVRYSFRDRKPPLHSLCPESKTPCIARSRLNSFLVRDDPPRIGASPFITPLSSIFGPETIPQLTAIITALKTTRRQESSLTARLPGFFHDSRYDFLANLRTRQACAGAEWAGAFQPNRGRRTVPRLCHRLIRRGRATGTERTCPWPLTCVRQSRESNFVAFLKWAGVVPEVVNALRKPALLGLGTRHLKCF